MNDTQTITTRSYTAGLMDGEGSVMLTRASKNQFRCPQVSLTNTSYELIEFMQTTFGGSVSRHKTYQEHHKPSWVWKLTHQAALDFLRLILPYMRESVKRARATYLLTKYDQVTQRNGKYTPDQLNAKLNFEEGFLMFS